MSGIIGGSRSGIINQSNIIPTINSTLLVTRTWETLLGAYNGSFTLTAAQAPIGSLVLFTIHQEGGSQVAGKWYLRLRQSNTGIDDSPVEQLTIGVTKNDASGYYGEYTTGYLPIPTASQRSFTYDGYHSAVVGSNSAWNKTFIYYMGYMYGAK
jgi:hypothetical protein